MSSLRSIFLGLLLVIPQFSTATPLPAADALVASANCYKPPKGTPVLPLSGNPTELPSTTQALKYVLIGRGVQNYTCAGPSATPVAIGAIATLYDATSLAYLSTKALNAIPPLAVYVPLPRSSSSLNLAANLLKPIGHHYFDAAGTPTFDLASVGKILYCAKNANVKAPATANKGPAGTGAVDWLQLLAKPGYTSVGLGTVYRVVTAGGVSPACTKAGQTSVQYAAEYWFYD